MKVDEIKFNLFVDYVIPRLHDYTIKVVQYCSRNIFNGLD